MRKRAAGAFEVIRQDSPTNNSEDEQSAYTCGQINVEEFMELMEEDSLGLCAENILGAVFGFNDKKKKQAFGYLKNGKTLDQAYAMDTFTLMYPGCTGEFWKAKLEFAARQHYGNYNYAKQIIYEAEYDIFRELKCYVSARGTVPPVMIDKNPYGILPVRALHYWDFNRSNEPALEAIGEICNREGYERCMDTVGVRWYADMQFIAERMEHIVKELPVPDDIYVRNLAHGAQAFRGDEEFFKTEMPIVSEGDLSRLRQCIHEAQSYIKLPYDPSDSSAAPPIFIEAPTANSLFEAIVKKSLLRIWEIYNTNASGAVEMINDMKTAIDFLSSEKGPSLSELEVLVKETLDIFSPRYDPWILALSARRLLATNRRHETITRNRDVPGVNQNLVGVFGWLCNLHQAKPVSDKDGYFQAPSADQATAAAMIRNASLYKGEEGNPFQVNLSSRRLKEAVWFIDGLRKGHSWAELLGMRLERLLHDQNLDRLLYSLRTSYPLDQARDSLKCSHLVNGELFLEDDDLEGKGFSREDAVILNTLRNRLRELADSVSDVFIAEIAYNLAAGNPDAANAWLTAFENKQMPPELRMAATPRTGQALQQRVVLPVDASEAEAAVKNPRHIAEPTLARLAHAVLSAHGYNSGARFNANVYLRASCADGTDTRMDSIIIDPVNDLGMSALDIVTGGRRELEAFARRFVFNTLLRNGKDLDGALRAEDPEAAFESKAYIVFEYGENFKKVLDKASELLTVIKSARPLDYGDIAKEKPDGQELYDMKIYSLRTLYKRLVRLSDLYRSAIEGLKKLKEILNDMLMQPGQSPGPKPPKSGINSYISQINELLDQLVRFGFQEANVFLHTEPESAPDLKPGRITLPDGTVQAKKPGISSIAKLDAIISKLESRKVGQITDEVLSYDVNKRIIIRYDFEQDRLVQSDRLMPGITMDLDESVKLTVLDVLLDKVRNQLKEWTSKDTMVILTPFMCREPLRTGGGSSREQLELYGKVRKNISALLSVTNRFTAGITGSVWEPGILEGIESVKGKLTEGMDAANAEAILDQLKDLKPEYRLLTDIHYLLLGDPITIQAETPVAGLVIDEWTDFIHSRSEVTSVAFKYRTPKSQAPNAILVAVPEYEYLYEHTKEWTHFLLAQHLAETLYLMTIRAAGIVSSPAPVMYFRTRSDNPLLR